MSAQVGIIMGSQSDWDTMRHCADALDELDVAYETRVVSAHRTPDLLFEGMTAAKTRLPVLGVPVQSKSLKGIDSLLSIAQMPAGVPVGTLAIGKAGAVNAALLAAAIVATHDTRVAAALERFREQQTNRVLSQSDPREP